MKHLTHFEVKSFRNVRPTRLEFRPSLNVVLGKNAAGKTSLLKLLEDSLTNFAAGVEDERNVGFGIVDGASRLGRRISRSRSKQVDPRGQPVFSNRDRFEMEIGQLRTVAEITDGEMKFGDEVKQTGENPYLALLSAVDKYPTEDTLKFFGLSLTRTARLDESLDYFQRLLGFWQSRLGDDIKNSLDTGRPRSLEKFEVTMGAGGPKFPLSFLDKAAAVMGYHSAEARVDVSTKTTGSTVETAYSNLRFAFRDGPDQFFHSNLSYGEKRLLAFFAMSDASDILIVDELINGLHHDWIRACLSELGGRQAFLTSQNPLLLDYLEFESAEDVRLGFVLCERATSKDTTELIWRNPTAEEASEFFAAYETGLQSVSEILISKGFW